MSDESKLNAEAARGARAEILLRNELLQEVFATLEARYIEEWRVTQSRDTDVRERLWQAVNIVRKVKDHLAAMLANGRLAQRELDDLAGTRRKS